MGLTLPDPKNVRNVAVLCHRHADADTYLSAYALSYILKKLMPEASVSIIVPDGMSTLTKKLAASFPHEGRAEVADYDLLVAVDIGHIELLGDWGEKLRRSGGLKILIDHHPPQQDSPYDQSIIDTTSSSAAELVYGLSRELGVELEPNVAQALLLAILFDSQYLSIAGPRTLRVVLDLIERGANLEEARASLRSPPDYGEVIAKLKAAKRAKIYRAKGWVIAVSTVGSFQANVARSFTQLGADVALVVGEVGKEVKGSLRAHQRFHTETKIHMGTDIAEGISKGRGYGGGHPTAASFTLTSGDEVGTVSDFLVLIGELLKEKPTEIT
ncbi:MAG: DHH family phosphoesterase [Thaumarchaeota archaeon]|nr:DHH family phosphoesterase [Nitrososphaerota archaeon]